ncbi:helix-turn-helix transcriptional regulator [Alkalihalobacterium alkalinitrilicum]|uniref:helix-turn-helix transcriptional regulator n=1 Tax=Alkalihalobacterium alkalinitrilicum TaxID=427920 RepID=UPI0011500AA3|nr:helix-turn-helix domain-containing protein [Alkalihalobacterium alkalinitrilicum]
MVDEKLIGIKELSEKLGVSEQQIYKLQREGLPKIKISHKVTRYDWEDVVQWLKTRDQN